MLQKDGKPSTHVGETKMNARGVEVSGQSTDRAANAGKATTGNFFQTLVRVFDPLIMYDAYTFRWLGFDPHEHVNTREQAFTKVTNVGLISALVFTVWASWLQVVATTSFDNYACSFFLRLTKPRMTTKRPGCCRLELWFTLPSIYFYLGVGCGSFGFMIWFPAAFPLKYALFNIAAGIAIIALNAPYYQFLILCVYDTRVEANLRIPSHPTWLVWLPMLGRKTSKDEATPTKPNQDNVSCVTPAVDDGNSPQDAVVKVLETALDSIGQIDLLPLFIDNGWDDIDALAELREHHVAQIATLKPGHIARFLRHLRRQL
ncbi:hypothetical protein PF007_g22050 [Phytophthora fragariae]|uniref:Uncharacterized protein n=1 Tax=Phytophthora fragariae TaxID=53985 RepID=A0A6A3QTS6_9STRA|nr:hypothetical protein PF007_g22050 [Phytophthora fragariae]KAE9185129.1 hypothetical protein PF004_g23456 [Phytophthora fragariae]